MIKHIFRGHGQAVGHSMNCTWSLRQSVLGPAHLNSWESLGCIFYQLHSYLLNQVWSLIMIWNWTYGSIYTMETSKYYKSEPFILQSQLLDIYQHTHCLELKFPQLSPSSLGTISHHCLICLYQNQTSHFISAMATHTWKVRPEHQVSCKRQALDFEKRYLLKFWSSPMPHPSQIAPQTHCP